MKKYKKRLSVILSAVIVLSSGMVQAFAAESESEIAWQYEQGRSVNTNSVQITCYSDGNIERFSSEFCYVVVNVPDGVNPDIEYFGVDRISYVSKFDKKFMYQTEYGQEIYSELEPEENEYIIGVTLDSLQTLCELEDEVTEIARNLMTEGKITSARVNYMVYKDTFNEIGGITINTDGSFIDTQPSDFPELAGYYDTDDEFKITNDGKFLTLSKYYTDKDILTKIVSVCDSLIENYDGIISVSPIFPEIPINDSENPDLYAAKSIYMWGDISRNNLIDLYDAIEISKYIMNITDIDEDTILLADINRDGVTDLYDAIEIAKTLLS